MSDFAKTEVSASLTGLRGSGLATCGGSTLATGSAAAAGAFSSLENPGSAEIGTGLSFVMESRTAEAVV